MAVTLIGTGTTLRSVPISAAVNESCHLTTNSATAAPTVNSATAAPNVNCATATPTDSSANANLRHTAKSSVTLCAATATRDISPSTNTRDCSASAAASNRDTLLQTVTPSRRDSDINRERDFLPTAHRRLRRPNPLPLLTANETDPEPITPRERDAQNYRIPSQRRATSANQQTSAPPLAIQKLRKKQDRAAADRVRRAATRRPRIAPSRLFCNICCVQCNSAKPIFDHRASRAHKFKIRTRGKTFECATCVRKFESPDHLERHLNSKGHLAVVYRAAANKN